MREAVLYLYGPPLDYPLVPFFKEDMFDRRDKLQRMLGQGDDGLELHIGYVHDRPTGEDRKPQKVTIIPNPAFDKQGCLIGGTFGLGDIAEYPVIVDHWVPNFRFPIEVEPGVKEEHANGIGIEAARLINAKRVQRYGNEKDAAARDILEPCGVALESFGTHELDRLGDLWGGGKVIFKPKAGSWGIGIQRFRTLKQMQEAIDQGEVAKNGLVQPFIDLTNSFPHLKALTSAYDEQLYEANSEPDRVREIRMHIFVTTENGKRQVKTYPTLRTSDKGAEVMKNQTYTPLDPEAFEEHYAHVVASTIRVGHTIAAAASVPNLYAVADSSRGTHARRQGIIEFVGDLNARGPRLPDVSLPGYDTITPAQQEFVIMQQTMGRVVLSSA